MEQSRRAHLVIEGVLDGPAGVQGNTLAFRPNRGPARPESVGGAILDGVPILLKTTKDEVGPFYTARFTVIG